jgi:hypothetical protein
MKNRYLAIITFLLATLVMSSMMIFVQANTKSNLADPIVPVPFDIDPKCKTNAMRIDSFNRALNWKQLKCGLWLNKNGDIGYKTQRVVCSDGLMSVEDYITRFGFNEGPSLKEIIDTTTFIELGNTYYKDKNHIYHHYAMSGGGSFYIFEDADYQTFQILGDCYAKDKNHIFESRAGILTHVDYASFKTKAGISGCVAKDKNGYIIWGDRVQLEEIDDKVLLQAIKELDAD